MRWVCVCVCYILLRTAASDQSKSGRPTASSLIRTQHLRLSLMTPTPILLCPSIGSGPKDRRLWRKLFHMKVKRSKSPRRTPFARRCKIQQKLAGEGVSALGGNFLMEWVLRWWKVPRLFPFPAGLNALVLQPPEVNWKLFILLTHPRAWKSLRRAMQVRTPVLA